MDENLANKIIDRMGGQIDKLTTDLGDLRLKLTTNFGDVNSKLVGMDVHMQSFTTAFVSMNERVGNAEVKLDRYQLMWNDFYSDDGKGIKAVAMKNSDRITALENNKRDGVTLWKALRWAGLTLTAVLTLVILIQHFWPTQSGNRLNDKLDQVQEKLDNK